MSAIPPSAYKGEQAALTQASQSMVFRWVCAVACCGMLWGLEGMVFWGLGGLVLLCGVVWAQVGGIDLVHTGRLGCISLCVCLCLSA